MMNIDEPHLVERGIRGIMFQIPYDSRSNGMRHAGACDGCISLGAMASHDLRRL